MDSTQFQRLTWNEYFLAIAETVSLRADCRRAKHGAVIVDKWNRIISTGYNGGSPGGKSCLAGECPRGLLSKDECIPLSDYKNCIAIHAEHNALVHSNGRNLHGTTIYLAGGKRPCDDCAKRIKEAGISKVVWQ